MANCAMPGCRNPAKNILGVRLRKEDTTAICIPNPHTIRWSDYECDS